MNFVPVTVRSVDLPSHLCPPQKQLIRNFFVFADEFIIKTKRRNEVKITWPSNT